MNKSKKDNAYSVAGIAKTFTIYAVFDDSRDKFKHAPPSVTKSFRDTTGIRTLMDVSDSSKVYAIVLEPCNSKGVTRYDLCAVRMGSGFAKGHVKELVSRGLTKGGASKFFNQPTVAPSAPDVKSQDVPSDDHHGTHVADGQGQGDKDDKDTQVPPQDACVCVSAPPREW